MPAPTFRELLSSTKKQIREVSVDEVKRLIDQRASIKVVDVRESDEYAAGRIPGAIWVPRGFLEIRIEEKVNRDEPLVLYCAGGDPVGLAAKKLEGKGSENSPSLAGPFAP